MSSRGFTLLEMLVATTVMAVAIVGLLTGLSTTTRNAARLRDYDRAVQLGRERMNELMVDPAVPHNGQLSGMFDPSQTGGLESGWRARVSTFEMPPGIRLNDPALDRLELEIWWKSGETTRTFTLDGYRLRPITMDDLNAPPGIQPGARKGAQK